MHETLTAAEIRQLARFDEHWRVILDNDDTMLVRSLAKRGYLDVLRRRVPLYRISPTARAMSREAVRFGNHGTYLFPIPAVSNEPRWAA